jgi:hypothetical protein
MTNISTFITQTDDANDTTSIVSNNTKKNNHVSFSTSNIDDDVEKVISILKILLILLIPILRILILLWI